jgi:hypothetical protein
MHEGSKRLLDPQRTKLAQQQRSITSHKAEVGHLGDFQTKRSKMHFLCKLDQLCVCSDVN